MLLILPSLSTAAAALAVVGLLAALATIVYLLRQLTRARGALRAARRDKDVVLASISDQVTFLDTDLRIVWSNWSERAQRPAETDPVPGVVCHRAIAHRNTPCAGCPAPEVLRTGLATEGVVTCSDGTVLRMSAAPVHDESGAVVGVVQTARDITQKRRLAERLQHAEKMEAVGRLAAGVAHDFNNSLQVILGNAELVAAELPTDEDQRHYLDAVLRAGRHARDVVRHLLTFSRRQEPRLEQVDLVSVIRRQVALMRSLLGDDIHVRVAASAGLPPALVDPGQLETVLLNLCLNARDAMPDGGVLDITVNGVTLDADAAGDRGAPAAGQYLVLCVRDEGEGIPPDLQDRIYDPFFTTKEVDRGTGLGLATVYGVVRAHHGFIELESEPGRGTCFRIGWPVAAASPRREAADGDASAARILVVEDDPGVRDLAMSVLAREGHDVDAASDGPEALARLQAAGERYDVVVMDVMLPGLNGWAVYTRARHTQPDLKVVFCSGHSPALLASEFRLDVPAMQFLQKPYRPVDLVGRVRDLLAGPALEARQERG